MDGLSVAGLAGLFLTIGLMLGLFIGTRNVEWVAFERGYMVECIGKTGYYWECEE